MKKRFPICIPVPWKICGCIGLLLLCLGYLYSYGGSVSNAEENDSAEGDFQGIYAKDSRLKLVSHETLEYDKEGHFSDNRLNNSYTRVNKIYDEEEIAEISHACFDENKRLLYVLGYSPSILSGGRSYCEENIYQRDDTKHTCRYIYYKSNSMPYKDGYYAASYEGAYLMSELQYYDYWGTNEVGAWEYHIYQYNASGNPILEVVTTEDEITLYSYEYHEDKGQVEVSSYLVEEDWELSCDGGSTYYFRPHWESPAIKKVAADGTVEKELFYGKGMDLGQQHYLMQEEVEETVDDHRYIVSPGDCLWNIAYKSYGNGEYYDLIYHMNRNVIGWDEDLILPGMRLYIPEAGNEQDTKVADL